MLKKLGVIIFFTFITLIALTRLNKLNTTYLFSVNKSTPPQGPPLAMTAQEDRGQVLASSTSDKGNVTDTIYFNIPAVFKKDITAPNIVYGLKAGSGITITGDKQNPTINSTAVAGVRSIAGQSGDIVLTGGTGITVTGTTFSNSGVTSLQGKTGAVTLEAGNNITIDGTKITATVPTPVTTNSFATITVTGQSSLAAGSSTDTLAVAAGTGISVTTNTSTKTLTISSSSSSSVTSITGTSNQVIASSSTGAVTLSLPQDIGTSSVPTFGRLGIGVSNSSALLSVGASSQFQVNSSGAIAAATGITSSGSINLTGLSSQTGTQLCITGGNVVGTCSTSSAGATGTGINNYVTRWTGASTLGTGVIYDNGTNVGIGTTTPGYKLDVNGTAHVSGAATFDSNATVTGSVITTSIDSGNSSNNITFTANGRTYIFPTTGGTSQTICTTGITCASGGGQAVLLAPGSAQSNASNTDASIFLNNTGAANILELQHSGADVLVVDTNGNLSFSSSTGPHQITTGGATNLALMPGGNVGIGTTAPGYKLDVNGTGNISGAVTLGSTLNVTGAITAPTSSNTINGLIINGSTLTFTANNITDSGGLTIKSASGANALTLDSGTTGNVNLGTGNNAKTINIGTGSSGNTINIGTNNSLADTINIASAIDTTTVAGIVKFTNLSSGTGNALCLNASNNVVTCTAGAGGLAGSGVVGQIAFFDTSSSVTGSNNFWWDSTNNRLGIGTTVPSQAIDIASSQGNLTFSSSTGPHQIKTGGATNLALMPGGNVGIGGTNPTSLLSVGASSQFQVNSSGAIAAATGITSSGSINLTGLSSQTGTQLCITGGNVVGTCSTSSAGATGTGINNYVTRWTGASTLGTGVIYDNGTNVGIGTTTPGTSALAVMGGNVGIGTTNPATTLQVNNATNLTNNGTASQYALNITQGSNTLGLGAASNYAALQSFNSQPLALNPAGNNVGIGGTNPTSLLSVGASSQFQVNSSGAIAAATGITSSGSINLTGLSSQTGTQLCITGGNVVGTCSTASAGITGSGVSGQVTFWNGSSSVTGNNNFWWDSTNNRLGIGTTVPSQAIDIGTSQGNLTFSNSTGPHQITTGGATNLALMPGGNVGIGTTAPGYKLDVNGTGNISGAVTLGSTLNVTGAITAPTSSNTINNLVINSGALSSVTGITTSGSYTQSGSSPNTFSGYNTFTAPGLALSVTNNAAVLGNLGIGTTNPSALLSVGTTSQFQVNSSGAIAAATGITSSGSINLTGLSSQTGTQLCITGGNVVGTCSTASAGITGSGVSGQVTFWNGSSSVTGNNNFWWDSTNNRLGIGTTVPSQAIDIGTSQGNLTFSNSTGPHQITTGGATNLALMPGGNVGIGGTNPSALLSVGSTSQFQVNSSGAVAAATGVTSSGTISFTGLGSGTGNGICLNGSNQLVTCTAGNGAVAGSGVSGQVTFWNGSSSVTGNNNFWWDSTNNRLGIGTTVPSQAIDIGTSQGNLTFSNSTGPHQITTGGATNLALMPGGNVGIGGTNPSALLSVGSTSQFQVNSSGAVAAATGVTSSGTISFTGLGSGTGNGICLNGSNQLVTCTAGNGAVAGSGVSGQVTFWNGSSSVTGNNNFWWDSTNNRLGIGTTVPSQAIDIGTSQGNLTFSNSTGPHQITTGGATNLALMPGGNVGIGGTNPSALLSVGSTSQFQVNSSGAVAAATGVTSSGTISFTGLGSGTGNGICLNGSNQLVTCTAGNGAVAGSGVSGQVTFWNGSSSVTGNNNFWWDSTNNRLGIGTTVPSQAIDIGTSQGNLTFSNSTGPHQITTGGATNLALMPGGNVGIGTTAPGYKLDVNGTGNISGAVTLGSTLNVTGAITAPTSSNTINNLVINSGALSSVTGITTSGSYTQSGSSPNTFSGYNTFTAPGLALSVTNNAAVLGNLGIGTTNPAESIDIASSQGNLTFSSSTGPHQIKTGGATNLALMPGGNVGIGGTNPTSLLSVGASSQFQVNSSGAIAAATGITSSGSINLTGLSSQTGTQLCITGGNVVGTCSTSSAGATGTGINNYVTRWTGASTLGTGVIYDNGTNVGIGTTTPGTSALAVMGGNVGIGTTNPATTLQVNNATNLTNNGTASQYALNITQGSNTLGLGAASNYAALQSFNSQPLALNPAGNNVGIGGTNPTSLLSVGASSQFQVNSSGAIAAATGITSSGSINLTGLSSQTGTQLCITGGNVVGTCSTASAGITGSGVSGQVTFWNGSSSVTGNNNFWWDSTNNRLGIGTTVPSQAIDIGTSQGNLTFSNSTGPHQITTGGATNLALMPGGNVGIGTTAPGYKLDVNGTGNISGAVTLGSTLNVTGAITAPTSSNTINNLVINSGALSSVTGITTSGSYTQSGSSPNTFSGYNTFTAPGLALSVTNNAAVLGNLGIGTTNPAESIDIASSQGNLTFSSSTGPHQIKTGGATNLALMPGGNVGIGGTNPSALLSVGSTSQFQVNSSGAVAAATGVTSSGTISFTGLGSGTGNAICLNGSNQLVTCTVGSGGLSGSGVAGQVSFFNTSSNLTGSNNFWWDSTNNRLGIGTTVPSQAIDIGTSQGNLTFSNSTGPHQITTGGATNLALMPGGNVGIGTTAPGYKLDVNGTGNISGAVTLGSTLNVTGAITAPTSSNTINNLVINSGALSSVTGITTSGSYTQSGSSPNTFSGYNTFTAPGLALSVTNNAAVLGNLGIGTTNPAESIDIASSQGNLTFSSSTGPHQIKTGGATNLALMPGGNVGIGGTNPTSLLSVGASSQFQVNSSGAIAAATGITSSGSINLTGLSSQTGTQLCITGGNVVGTCSTSSAGATGTGINNYVTRWTGASTLGTGVIYDNGTNVGIGTTTPGTSALAVMGGNVGIGTTNPATTLQVNNATNLTNNGTASQYALNITQGSNTLGLGAASNYAALQSFNSQPLALNPAGNNVGIGGTNPTSLLSVGASSQFQVNSSGAIAAATGITSSGSINLTGLSSQTGTQLCITGGNVVGTCSTASAGITGSGVSGQVTFWNGSSSVTGNNNFWWDSTNNRLGIGTTVPSQAIDIGTSQGNLTFSNSTGPHQITTGGATNLALMPGGNVGIGTTAPGYKLDVNGTGNISGAVTLGSTLNVTGAITAPTSSNTINNLVINSGALSSVTGITTSGSYTQSGSSPNTFSGYNTFTAPGLALSVTNNAAVLGNLGIGTTNPAESIDIASSQGNLTFSSSTGPHQIKTGGATNLALMPGGNVGIGGTNPTSLLSVGASSQFQVNSSGAIAAATGITSSGSINLTGLSSQTGTQLCITGGNVVGTCSTSSAGATGTGINNYVTRWTGASTLGTGVIYDNGTNVGIGTTTPGTSALAVMGGNVGIGTTNPATTLQVNNATNLTNNGTASQYALNITQGSNTLGLGAASNYAALQSFNSQPLALNPAGNNVGIGGTNPTSLLSVGASSQFQVNSSGAIAAATGITSSGSINLTGLSSQTGTQLCITGGNVVGTCSTSSAGATGTGINNYVTRWTGASTLGTGVIYDNGTNVGIGTTTPGTSALAVMGGNVGIGTTNPATTLQVNNATNLTNNGTASQYALNITQGSNTLGLGAASNYAALQSFNSQPLALNPAGNNVGIGGTNPTSLLSVGASSQFQVNSSGAIAAATGITSSGSINLTGLSSQTGTQLCITGGNVVGTCSTASAGITGSGVSGQVTFWNGSSSVTGNNNFWWDSTNNRLGIGTTVPSQAIDIGTSQGNLTFSNSTGPHQITTGGATNLALMPGGNVGIGTTAPGYKLDVNGTGNISGAVTLGSTLNVTGAITAPTSSNTINNLVINSGALSSVTGITTSGSYTQSGSSPNTFSGYNTFTAPGLALSVTNNAAVLGNLGIGTTNPAESIDIASSQGNLTFSSSTGPHQIKTGGATNLALMPGGNVGIGGTNPTSLLSVGASSQFQVNSSGAIAAATGITSSGSINLTGLSSQTGTQLCITGGNVVGTCSTSSAGATGTGINNYVTRWTGASTLGTGVIYDNGTNVGIGTTTPGTSALAVMGGNVGIGTTNPATTLQVNNATNLTNNGTASQYALNITQGSNTLGLGAASNYAALQSFNSQPLALNPAGNNVGIGTTNPGVAKLAVFGGNVGIGTTTPGQALDVVGNVAIESAATDANSTTAALDINGPYIRIGDAINPQTFANGLGIKFNDAGVAHASIKYLSSAGKIFFCDSSNTSSLACNAGAETVTMDLTNKYLGVGTTAPSALLSVGASSQFQVNSSGAIAAATGITSSGSINLTGLSSQTGTQLCITGGNVVGTCSTSSAGATGTGINNYVTRWTGASTLGTGVIYDNGTNVGIGTTNPIAQLNIEKSSYTNNQVVISDGVTGTPPTYPLSFTSALTVQSNETSGSRPLYFGYNNAGSWDALMTVGACGTFTSMCLDMGSGSNVYTPLKSNGSTLQIAGGTNSDGTYTNVTFNNSGDVTFNNSGKVGIGTNSPSEYLDIGSSGANLTFSSATGPHQIKTGGATNLALMPGGNVGIGTTNPTSPLHLVTGTQAAVTFADSNASGLDFKLSATGTGGRDYTLSSTANSSTYAGGNFVISDSTASQARLLIDSNGNVGIGSSGNNITSGTFAGATMVLKNGNVGIGTTNPSGLFDVNGKLTVLSGGSVGIGTVNPTDKLTVYGAGRFGSGGFGQLQVGQDDGTYLNISTLDSNRSLKFSANGTGQVVTNNDFLFATSTGIWNASGNVGMGTITPGTARLSVMGGNVGIGTTAPADLMTVVTTTNDKGFQLQGATGSVSPTFKVANSAGTVYSRIGIAGSTGGLSSGTVANDLVIRTENSNMFFNTNAGGSPAMIITSNGNVGIGTTSAPQRLTIDNYVNDGSTANIRIRSLSTRYRSDYLIAGAGGVTMNTYDDTGATYLPFQIDASKTILGMQGNVGIGTTAPSSALSVGLTSQFQVNSSGAIAAATGITSSGTISFTGLGSQSGTAVCLSGSNIIGTCSGGSVTGTGINNYVARWTGGTTQGTGIIYDNNSGVGIGTTTPGTAKLAVMGGNLGIGITAPSALTHILGTTEQLRLGYDTTNYQSFTVNSTAGLTVKPAVNSTTALQYQTSGAGNLLAIDSTNSIMDLLSNNTGELKAWQTNGNNTNSVMGDFGTATYNGYIYMVGGYTQTNSSSNTTVQYAKLNADGSTGTWSTTSTLPAARSGCGTYAVGGYLYCVNGYNSGAQQNIYYSKINIDGTVGTWQTQSGNLPANASFDSGYFTANGYIYLVGGAGSGVAAQKWVAYAKVLPTGGTGPWTQLDTALPTAEVAPSTVYANGYVYAVGGYDTNTTGSASTNVQYAKVNTNGTLGTFTDQGSNKLGLARGYAPGATVNGYVYVLGGNNSGDTNTVQYSKIQSDHSLGAWTTSSRTLPGSKELFGSVPVVNGFVYFYAGANGGSDTQTVYYAQASKLRLGGALDLLADGNGLDLADGRTSGQLTAGSTDIVGDLQVRGDTNFRGTLNIEGITNHGGDIGFYNNSSSVFQILTGGSSNLALMPGGNVGIGTTNPSQSLDIGTSQGNLTFSSSTGPHQILTGGATNLALMPGGNVGIGTTNPGSPFTIVTSTQQAQLITDTHANGLDFKLSATGTGGRDFTFSSTANSSTYSGGRFVISDSTAGQARFMIDQNGNVGIGSSGNNITSGTFAGATMVLKNGNVGIGTTNPGASLDLASAGTIQGAGLSGDCSSTSSKLLWSSTTKQFLCGTDRASKTIVKSSGQSMSNSTTLVDDNTLSFTPGSSETWIVDMQFHYSQANTTGGYKFSLAAPASSTCSWEGVVYYLGANTYGTSTCGDTLWHATDSSYAAVNEPVRITGQVVTPVSSSGNIRLQFAQNTANAGAITINSGEMLAYKVSGADLAEIYYGTERDIQQGMVVQMDPDNVAGVKKATAPYGSNILGVVSTKPGTVLADDIIPVGAVLPIALAGRVPVKVSAINGNINVGDLLTASSIPGVAMKATRPGYIIGRALTSFAGQGTGVLMAFVNTQYADPGMIMNLKDGIQVDANTPKVDNIVISYNTTGDLVLKNTDGNFNMPGLTADKKNEIKITDVLIKLDELSRKQAEQATSSGVLTAHDRELLGKLNLDENGNLTTDKLKANEITANKITVVHDATNSAVLGASSSATLNASSSAALNSTSSATLATPSAGFDIEKRFDDLSKELDILKGQSFAASVSASLKSADTILNSSASAQLGSLTVLGNANLFNLGVTGDLSVGLLNISSGIGNGTNATESASISTLSGPLKLQASALGGIDFLNGKATIDTSGNLVVRESISTKQLKIDATDKTSASIGESTLHFGETSATIYTGAAQSTSRIFVTPKTSISAPLSVTQQSNGAFTVEIAGPQTRDVKFNWWIVN